MVLNYSAILDAAEMSQVALTINFYNGSMYIIKASNYLLPKCYISHFLGLTIHHLLPNQQLLIKERLKYYDLFTDTL
jgi:hypothetical protein